MLPMGRQNNLEDVQSINSQTRGRWGASSIFPAGMRCRPACHVEPEREAGSAPLNRTLEGKTCTNRSLGMCWGSSARCAGPGGPRAGPRLPGHGRRTYRAPRLRAPAPARGSGPLRVHVRSGCNQGRLAVIKYRGNKPRGWCAAGARGGSVGACCRGGRPAQRGSLWYTSLVAQAGTLVVQMHKTQNKQQLRHGRGRRGSAGGTDAAAGPADRAGCPGNRRWESARSPGANRVHKSPQLARRQPAAGARETLPQRSHRARQQAAAAPAAAARER
jgi:hypothetical protein